MDPIENGNDIFRNILPKYPEKVRDISLAYQLIDELIQATEGWLITDFIGFGGWDRLSRISINLQTGHLTLIEREANSDGFPFDFKATKENLKYRSGLILHFKDLIQFNSENLSGVFLRGYATKEKQVKKLYSKNSSKFNFEEHEKRHFSTYFRREVNAVEESFEFHNTPIYSIAIIPKNTPLGYPQSQELLFSINFETSLIKLKERKDQLTQTVKDDEDTICEKVNTGRRVFEFVLKIECCLIEEMVSLWDYEVDNKTQFSRDYNDLRLGDLVKIIKPFKPESEQNNLNKIVRGTNRLSHDSGEPIIHSEAIVIFDLLISYTNNLSTLITDRNKLNDHYSSNFNKREYDLSKIKVKTYKFSELLKKDEKSG